MTVHHKAVLTLSAFGSRHAVWDCYQHHAQDYAGDYDCGCACTPVQVLLGVGLRCVCGVCWDFAHNACLGYVWHACQDFA